MNALREDSGVSLLELVAVLAIYSLVAIMSLQLLSNAALSRSQVSGITQLSAKASAIAAVLRRDLEEMTPASGATPPLFGEDSAAFHRAQGPGSRPVAWRLQAGALLRETEDGAQRMAENVERLSFRVIGASGGWMPGTSFSPARPGDLPRGIEARFDLGDVGTVRVVVAR